MIGALSKSMCYARGKIKVGNKPSKIKAETESISSDKNELPKKSNKKHKENSPCEDSGNYSGNQNYEFPLEDSDDSTLEKPTFMCRRKIKIIDDDDEVEEKVPDDDMESNREEEEDDQEEDEKLAASSVFVIKPLTVDVYNDPDVQNYSMKNLEKVFTKEVSPCDESVEMKVSSLQPCATSTPKRNFDEIETIPDNQKKLKKKNSDEENQFNQSKAMTATSQADCIPSSQQIAKPQTNLSGEISATQQLSESQVNLADQIPSSQPVRSAIDSVCDTDSRSSTIESGNISTETACTEKSTVKDAEKKCKEIPEEEEEMSEAQALAFFKKLQKNKKLLAKIMGPDGN